MIDISEIPRVNGLPVGQFRIKYGTITVAMHDARMVDGVSVTPVTGRTLQRLRMSWGATCVIEPWDGESLELVAQHLDSIGRGQRAAELRALLAPPAPPAAAADAPVEPVVEAKPETPEAEQTPGAEQPAASDSTVAEAALDPEAKVDAPAPPAAAADEPDGAEDASADSEPEIPGHNSSPELDKLDNIEALRAIATAAGVTVNPQWGAKRLRKEIRAAKKA